MKSLKNLSDQELVGSLQTLTKKEKAITLEIVGHLVEVIRRGLHLAQGFGSLYEYCKGELGCTDASAWRRSRAAQAIIRCPQAWDRLRDGAVNLCTLGRVYKFITPGNPGTHSKSAEASAITGTVYERLRSEVFSVERNEGNSSGQREARGLRSEVRDGRLEYEQK